MKTQNFHMVGGHFSCMKKRQNTSFSKENLEFMRPLYLVLPLPAPAITALPSTLGTSILPLSCPVPLPSPLLYIVLMI